MQLTSIGVELLLRVLRDVADGNPIRQPQDQSRVTYCSAADIARARIPFAQWPAERVWHVLSGLGDQFHHLLAAPGTQQLAHGRAMRYIIDNNIEPGRIVTTDSGYELHCRDGVVSVDRHKHHRTWRNRSQRL